MENMVTMLNELKTTYQGKKVFLTGHTGFKGAWLLKTLNILGAEVMGYALAPQDENDLYNLINGESLCISVISDLRERKALKDALLEFQPDFIFHLAAQPLVRLSYEIPSETFEVNAIGTANLLDAVKCLEKPCSIILITTDKVYHNNEWEYPYRENDKLGGYDPYSASKACAELIIDSYRNSFFNTSAYAKHKKGIAVARAGNVIGGGDWSKDRLIPDIVRSLIQHKNVTIRNPDAVRPWQHVLEPIIGYLLLGMHLTKDPQTYSEAFNFGPLFKDALSVINLLDLTIKCWGRGSYTVSQHANQPHEAGILRLDISKAISKLNWSPKLDAKKAVELTIDWYKQLHENVYAIGLFTGEQIKDYLNG